MQDAHDALCSKEPICYKANKEGRNHSGNRQCTICRSDLHTIALSNSIAFQQMTDPGKQFPWIRVFGTLGWIVAGIMIGKLGIEKTAFTFQMAAIASVALGLFSFILPNTPPKGKSADASASSAIGADAFILFKDKPYLIFFIAAILVCIPTSFRKRLANP